MNDSNLYTRQAGLCLCRPEQYEQQLQRKQQTLLTQLQSFDCPKIQVHPSIPSHYRMRVEFRVWHDGDRHDYIMFDPASKTRVVIEHCTLADETIAHLMQPLLSELAQQETLIRSLYQVDFLASTQGEVLVSLIYKRPLTDDWEAAMARVQTTINRDSGLDVFFMGRAKKQKRLLPHPKAPQGRSYVLEHVQTQVHGVPRTWHFKQVENTFSQPNATINQRMIQWVLDHVQADANRDDCVELYCGYGNFSLPLSQRFRQVFATEIAKPSVQAGQWAIETNGVSNVDIQAMAAETFASQLSDQSWQSPNGHSYDFTTLLVDPPRAGLDAHTRQLASQFEQVIYISCNPETLARDLYELQTHFTIRYLALFDQFPYTPHIETGVILQRKTSLKKDTPS